MIFDPKNIDEEIEVTEEMIEAGDNQLCFYEDEPMESPYHRSRVIRNIFIAMLKKYSRNMAPSEE